MQHDAVVEDRRQAQRVEGVAEVRRRPRSLVTDTDDAVAEIAILAGDVGEGVVLVVVVALPSLGRAGRIPLEVGGGKRRIVGPVVLAVEDVVPNLHVVQNLREGERADAGQPERRQEAQEQRGPSDDLGPALHPYDAPDVADVFGTELGHHPGSQGLEFDLERIELHGSEAVGLGNGGHGSTFFIEGITDRFRRRPPERSHRSGCAHRVHS